MSIIQCFQLNSVFFLSSVPKYFKIIHILFHFSRFDMVQVLD